MSGTKVRCKFSVGRNGRRTVNAKDAAAVVAEFAPEGPSRAARILALAYHIEAMIEAGELKDYAAAAHSLGVTRARATQIAGMLLLSPQIQERVLTGTNPIPARLLRSIVREADWETQRLLGHSDPKLTAQAYTQLDTEDLRRGVDSRPRLRVARG